MIDGDLTTYEYCPAPRWCGVDDTGKLHVAIDAKRLHQIGVKDPYFVEDINALRWENGVLVEVYPQERIADSEHRIVRSVAILSGQAAARTLINKAADDIAKDAKDFGLSNSRESRAAFIAKVLKDRILPQSIWKETAKTDALATFLSEYPTGQSRRFIRECLHTPAMQSNSYLIAVCTCLEDITILDYNPAPLPDRIPIFRDMTSVLSKIYTTTEQSLALMAK